jgi:hypothetical protein
MHNEHRTPIELSEPKIDAYTSACSGEPSKVSEAGVTLTAEELSFLVGDLWADGHGHGGQGDDFEPECPLCTATDKLAVALAATKGLS